MSTAADKTVDADVELLQEELTPELKLEAYFDSISTGDEISIGVYQIDPSNRSRKGFLFYCDPDELAPHELFAKCLADWGPGEYEAIARDGQQISFAQRFVLGTIKKEKFSTSAPPSTVQPPNAAPATDPAIIALLQAQQKTLDQLVAKQTAEPQRSALDVLKEAAEMRKLFEPTVAPAPAATSGLGEVLNIVKEVLILKDELGSEEGDALTTAIKTLGPTIVKAVEHLQANPAPATVRRGTPLSPGSPARAPTVNAQGAGRMIGPYLPTIIGNARGGVQPIDAAKQILTQLDPAPPDVKAALLDYLDDELAVDKIAAMEPEVDEHREWFEELVDVLIGSLSQQLGVTTFEETAAAEPAAEIVEPVVEPAGIVRDVGDWSPDDVGSDPHAGPAEPDATADAQGGEH